MTASFTTERYGGSFRRSAATMLSCVSSPIREASCGNAANEYLAALVWLASYGQIRPKKVPTFDRTRKRSRVFMLSTRTVVRPMGVRPFTVS